MTKFEGPSLVAACGLLLAGCSTFGPTGQQSLDMDKRESGTEASYSPYNWSPPNYAGMTAGRIIYPGKDGGAPVVAEWISGKEAESATIKALQARREESKGRRETLNSQRRKLALKTQEARDQERAYRNRKAGLQAHLPSDFDPGTGDARCWPSPR